MRIRNVFLCAFSVLTLAAVAACGGANPTPRLRTAPNAPVVSPSGALTLNEGIPQSVTVTSGIGDTITATSSNTAVVTVPASENTGAGTQATFLLTPLSVGTATITFTDPTGQTATTGITVINVNPSPNPNPSGGIIGANETITFQIPAKSEITATSSSSAILSVSPSASPTGGYAYITGTTGAAGNVTVTFQDVAGDTGTFNGQVSAITNGGFTVASQASLQGWTPCSYPKDPYSAPITMTAYDDGTAQTAATTAVTSGLSAMATTMPASSVPDSNPTASPLPSYPPFGSNVAEVGSTNGSTNPFPQGTFGICQTVTLPATPTEYLSFYGWLAGGGYSFKDEDQEADILTSGASTINSTGASTLFAEQACYLNPTGSPPSGTGTLAGPIIGPGVSTADSCWGGYAGTYMDWIYGGYWQPFGPYSLAAYAGQTVTLFIGDWNDNTGSFADNTYDAQLLFVANVETSTAPRTLPTSAPLSKTRTIMITMPRKRGTGPIMMQSVKQPIH
jgi:hypothetical protein